MDYIIQLQNEREELLSPVFNTEQISLSQIKLPIVQPILNDVNRYIDVILDGQDVTYTMDPDALTPNPTLSEFVQLVSDALGQGWTVSIYGDIYMTISHSLTWSFKSRHSLLGLPENGKAFSPNLSPPNIHVTLGDQEEWWRSKIGEQTALMADTECGCTFVDALSEHQMFAWKHKGKTVEEIKIKFEWEHGGRMWPYDFMGREWIAKVILRGELDRRVTQFDGSHGEGEGGGPLRVAFARVDTKRMRDIGLILIGIMAIVTVASMSPSPSRRTRAGRA